MDDFYDPVPGTEGKSYVDQAAFIDDIDSFDRHAFNMSPSQVSQMDPQQRLALQVALEAFMDAGYKDRTKLRGSNTGVFAGVCSNDWHKVKKDPSFLGGGFDVAGGANSMIANRISFEFGLKGPSVAIDSACSSSLQAVDMARRAILGGVCDRALVLGVNLILSPDTFIGECQATMLSPSCRSKAFDDEADGFARGEGCAAIVLEKPGHGPKSDAYAELIGSASNHDGRSASLLAPNGPAQTAVINAALAEAGIAGYEVDFLETHGTGTKVGDPLEFNAFQEALAPGRSPQRPLHIGALKTNVGHLEGAAGIAGLVKAALVLQHAQVPANLHFRKLNSHIDAEGFPVVFPSQTVALPATNGPLVGSVSSWGFGGSNVHAVLRQATHTRKPQEEDIKRETGQGSVATDIAPSPGLVAMFTGQGSQSVNMASSLYRSDSTFRNCIDECAAIADDLLDRPLLSVLYPLAGDEARAAQLIEDTSYSQVCLFAVELGLFRMLQREGFCPAVVLGHSLGEFVAAHVAGCLSLRDAMRLVATRGKLLGALPRNVGSMVALVASAEEVAATIRRLQLSQCSIAAINSPRMTVVSGAKREVDEVSRSIGCVARPLKVSHAFHSPLMRPALRGFEEALANVKIRAPQPGGIQLVSCVTGRLAGVELENPSHWLSHIVDPVRFLDAVQQAHRLGGRYFVEIGPRAVLAKLVRQCITAPLTITATQDPPKDDHVAWSEAIVKVRGVVNAQLPPAVAITQPSTAPITRPAIAKRAERFPYRKTQHPLLKNRKDHSDGRVTFTVSIRHSLASLLKQHVVHGRVVIPGALHMELAASAARQVHSSSAGCIVLEDVTFSAPCVLSAEDMQGDDSGKILPSLFCTVCPSDRTISIAFGQGSPETLSPNVEAQYVILDNNSAPRTGSVGGGMNNRTSPSDEHQAAAEVYRHFELKGLQYGPHFRTLQSISGSRSQAHARHSLALVGHGMFAHPCLLDGILQTSAGLFLDTLASTPARMPFNVERIEFLRPLPSCVNVVATRTDNATDDRFLRIDLAVYSENDDELLMMVSGLQSRPAPSSGAALAPFKEAGTPIFYQQAYAHEEVRRDAPISAQSVQQVSYVVVGDRFNPIKRRLIDTLGYSTQVVELETLTPHQATSHRTNTSNVRTVVVDCRAFDESRPRLSGIDTDWEEDLATSTLAYYASLCNSEHLPDRLVHITSGALNPGPAVRTVKGAALVGMAKAFKVEQYHLPITVMALDVQDEDVTAPSLIVDEIAAAVRGDSSNGGFIQIGLRGSTRSVPVTVMAPVSCDSRSGFEDGRSSLRLQTAAEVTRLLASSTTTFEEENRAMVERFSCADAELQDVCSQLMAHAAWQTQRWEVTPHLLRTWQRYRTSPPREAFSALLERLARLRTEYPDATGNKSLLGPQLVLLESTAKQLNEVFTGRVDPLTLLFADQNQDAAGELYKSTFLARHFNKLVVAAVIDAIQTSALPADYTVQVLEIGAGTGGTASFVLPALRDLGVRVRYCFTDLSSSLLARARKNFSRYPFIEYRMLDVERPCEPQGFAPETFDIVLATNVLHATADLDAVMANVRELMLPGGRLIVSELTRVMPFADCTFGLTTGWNAHEDRYRRDGPLLSAASWFDVFRNARLQPLAHSSQESIFANQAILVAARDAAAPPSTRQRLEIHRSDATYLITGGLGGLGLLTAKTMVEQGARNIILVSRSGKPAVGSKDDWDTLNALCARSSVRLEVFGYDISDEGNVTALFSRIRSLGLPPIRGVVHSAGILQDGTFTAQTAASYRAVLKTKAAAARLLQAQLPHLDFFVSYSSVASLLGAPGQSNHTAANTLLDCAAEWQWAAAHSGSRPSFASLAVQWGAVSGVGDAARRGAADAEKRSSSVHAAIPKDTAEALIRKLFTVAFQRPVITFVPFLWHNLWKTDCKFASERFAAFKPARYLPPAGATPEASATRQGPALTVNADKPVESRPVPSAQPAAAAPALTQILDETVEDVLGRSVEPTESLVDAGVDSLGAIDFRNKLQKKIPGLRAPATLLFEHPTKAALLEFLAKHAPAAATRQTPLPQQQVPVKPAPERSEITTAVSPDRPQRELAVVGLACRLPQADSPQEFWDLLSKHPSTAFGRVPADRCDMTSVLDPSGKSRAAAYTDTGAFVRDADMFDHTAFGLPAFEAAAMDPQQRVLLEVSLRAFADAGLNRETLTGSRIGVYVGAMNFDAAFKSSQHAGEAHGAAAAAPSLLSSRLSNVFGLQGPSLTIDTACSSSLVALEMAAEALRQRKIDRALVASVNVISSTRTYVAECAAGMLSRRGVCAPFDNQADGFVRGEGAVAIVLQHLEDATGEVHAVVNGIAINHNGRTAANLTSPSPSAQESVIRAALADAAVDPAQVGYVECHGTGTKLGDPIEISALQNVFDSPSSLPQQPLFVGAAKATVGHTESAAGLVGLLKAVLVLKHGKVPPLSHINRTNEHLQLEGSRLELPKAWTQLDGSNPIAGVSSFGFSGVNCHAVLRRPDAVSLQSVRSMALPEPKLNRVWFPLTSVHSAAGIELTQDVTFKPGQVYPDNGSSVQNSAFSASFRHGLSTAFLAEKFCGASRPQALLLSLELMSAVMQPQGVNKSALALQSGVLRAPYEITSDSQSGLQAHTITDGLLGVRCTFGSLSAILATASVAPVAAAVPNQLDVQPGDDVLTNSHLGPAFYPPGVSGVHHDRSVRRVRFKFTRSKDQLYICPSHANIIQAACDVVVSLQGSEHRNPLVVGFGSLVAVPGSSKFTVDIAVRSSGDGELCLDILAIAEESKSGLHVCGLRVALASADRAAISLTKLDLRPVLDLYELSHSPSGRAWRVDGSQNRSGGFGSVNSISIDQLQTDRMAADDVAVFPATDLSATADILEKWAIKASNRHLWILCSRENHLMPALRALVQTFRLEHPRCSIGIVTGEGHVEDLVPRVPIELGPEVHIAHGGRLHLPCLLPATPTSKFQQQGRTTPNLMRGTFVITGGTGGLGLATAEALLEASAAHVALLSRSGRATKGSNERLSRLLFNEPSRLSVHQADVTDELQVTDVVRQLQSRWGSITGVFHAAGQLSGEKEGVTTKGFNSASFERHRAVKVDGLRTLLTALRNTSVEVVVGFSSTSALLGLRHQAEYAAANAAMDAVLLDEEQQQSRYQSTTRYVSLQIDAVASVGFAARTLSSGAEQEGMMPLQDFKRAIVQVAQSASGVVSLIDNRRAAVWLSRQGVKRTAAQPSPNGPFPDTKGKEAAGAKVTESPVDGSGPVPVLIRSAFEEVTGHSLESDSTPFFDAGLDSLTSVSFRHVLEDRLGCTLPTSIAFDYPNLNKLVSFLHKETAVVTRSLQEAPKSINRTTAAAISGAATSAQDDDDIVVTGMDCVFPGADGIEAFWDVLMSGKDMVAPISPDRLDLEGYNKHLLQQTEGEEEAAVTIREAAMLSYDQVFSFDHAFFGMSRRESEATDPAQRLVLRTCWQALHRAGFTRDGLEGKQVGVFVGAGPSEWSKALGFRNALTGAGSASSLLANRVSYCFGLRGPSLVVDTACSSSLVALHLARAAILRGECEAAVVCGVQVHLHPSSFEQVSRSKMVSPSDNRSKPFDAAADGYGRGEGCGAVVLVRASDAAAAVADVPPLAVLRGSAVNSDGRSASLTAPSGPSQVDVIREALADACLEPGDVAYVETHGTGTSLGDPIEFNALKSVFGSSSSSSSSSPRQQPLVLGALKGQIGHLEGAAGIASFIKAVLALNHGLAPPNVNFRRLNPAVVGDGFDFVLPTRPQPLAPVHHSRDRGSDAALAAGISSFGFGGTNAHVVVTAAAPAAEETSFRAADDGPSPAALIRRGLRLRAPHRFAPTLVEPPARSLHPRRRQPVHATTGVASPIMLSSPPPAAAVLPPRLSSPSSLSLGPSRGRGGGTFQVRFQSGGGRGPRATAAAVVPVVSTSTTTMMARSSVQEGVAGVAGSSSSTTAVHRQFRFKFSERMG
ncbi:Phthiocerol synthesis polyketide synthase type I PpsA [Lasiodiplodia theobromae]|uniref:Phthiocerol synthesis polyketide synthase type I PpsA n=1 Tax=Lasiodiplodia theobromae TaxID=45133 RepID=A0A5N5DEG6_9PEZI|nr:Phthiocerol synthesis polyketide synthase type I PpsA [Lasiodiplodia theobromae]